jgi:predicted nucleic acid-binding protein
VTEWLSSPITRWSSPGLTDSQANAYTRRLFTRAERETVQVPALWPFEFVNTLCTMQRRNIMRPHQVDATLAQAQRFGIVIDAEPVKQAILLATARRAGLLAYDAAYVELAERRGLPLATRDRAMRLAARRIGIALV